MRGTLGGRFGTINSKDISLLPLWVRDRQMGVELEDDTSSSNYYWSETVVPAPSEPARANEDKNEV